jgi:hypothetical protein
MTQTYNFINAPITGGLEAVEGANRAEGTETGWVGAEKDVEWRAEQTAFVALAAEADDEALAVDD